MSVSSFKPSDIVASEIDKLVIGPTWSGSVAELFDALNAGAEPTVRNSFSWPRSAVALATRFGQLAAPLRYYRLRISRFPGALLIERLDGARSLAA